MAQSALERRRHRRVDVPVEVSFRLTGENKENQNWAGEATDVGLAGVLVKVKGPVELAAGTPITYSAEVPLSQQRQFPFTRLLGTGWIVRTSPMDSEGKTGVAIAFTSDTTALSSIKY